MPGFSTVILTLNEEHNLPEVLDSLGTHADDVWVIDSGSTDRTVEIARERGAQVLVRPFDNFGAQRNFAHEAGQFRHPWVLHLDADERMTPELAAEISALSAETEFDGYLISAQMLFFGHWIPRSTGFPVYQTRLVRARGFRFIQVGHGQREAPDMRIGKLQQSYRHEMMSDGVDAWLAKHRRYAREEAAHALADAGGPVGLADLFRGDRTQKRRALKRLAARLPARGLLRFVYQYFLSGGLLEGLAGYRYCRLLARYEGWVAEEMRKR